MARRTIVRLQRCAGQADPERKPDVETEE